MCYGTFTKCFFMLARVEVTRSDLDQAPLTVLRIGFLETRLQSLLIRSRSSSVILSRSILPTGILCSYARILLAAIAFLMLQ